MAITIDYTIDSELSIDADGVTLTRQRRFTAESILALYESNRIPQRGSRHPDNSYFRLVSGQCEIVGNVGNNRQIMWTGTYRASGSASAGAGLSGGNDRDPWELGATDFRDVPFTTSDEEDWVFKPGDNTGFRLTNSANCRYALRHDRYGREITFLFATKNKPNVNYQPQINAATVTVAGQTIEEYNGLLMPLTRRRVVEYDDQGAVSRSYWEVSATVRIHPLSWKKSQLDVGTLAFDANVPAASRTPEPINRYTPWASTDAATNLATPPSFGSINAVTAAKQNYALIATRAKYGQSWLPTQKNPEATAYYYQCFQDLPYSEVTDPLPLKDGFVYTDALKDPATYSYKTSAAYLEYRSSNWTQYNLPAKLEG